MAKQEVVTPVPGTFYRRPDPESDPFKSEGDSVQSGETIGLVEIMKNFQEVHAEANGEARRVSRRERGHGRRRADCRGARRRRMKRILVANRGEIAVRVIRAAHDLGLEAVAVYSEADAEAPHVRMADQALAIGPAAAARSYLNIDTIVKAAQASGSEAVHPGYGFLAERTDFAAAVEDAGLVFIGPRPEHIELMGDKARARVAATDAGVPTIPGSEETVSSAQEATTVAGEIGYPIALKAAGGGGGRGIRIVHDEAASKAITGPPPGRRRERSATSGCTSSGSWCRRGT